MSESIESTRNWTLTFVAVLLTEVLVIAGLWLFSQHFTY